MEKEVSKLKGPNLKKFMSNAAKEYGIKELVNYASKIPEEKLKKMRYEHEALDFLTKKAKEENQPFADFITPTLLKEQIGPQANRLLCWRYKIIWHPLPKK